MLVVGIVIRLLLSGQPLIHAFTLQSGDLNRNFEASDKITINAAYGKKYEIEVRESSRLRISTSAGGTTEIEVQSGRIDVDSLAEWKVLKAGERYTSAPVKPGGEAYRTLITRAPSLLRPRDGEVFVRKLDLEKFGFSFQIEDDALMVQLQVSSFRDPALNLIDEVLKKSRFEFELADGTYSVRARAIYAGNVAGPWTQSHILVVKTETPFHLTGMDIRDIKATTFRNSSR